MSSDKPAAVEVLDREEDGEEKVEKKKPPLHPVVEAITGLPEDDPEAVRAALAENPGSLERLDESGMTPLMHACWKGKKSTVKMILDMVRNISLPPSSSLTLAVAFVAVITVGASVAAAAAATSAF